MSKKDEALKMAIEVMNNYQNGWMPDEMASAMIACKKALKKEWQELSDDEISELAKKHAITSHNLGGGGFFAMEIQQKLKEKNS